MAEITAAMVKDLRERTGAGMMECKKALEEAGGDMKKAEELLRMGKSLEDARCGGTSGCVETGAFGKEAYILTGYFHLPKILEIALHAGVDPPRRRRLGLPPGAHVRLSATPLSS